MNVNTGEITALPEDINLALADFGTGAPCPNGAAFDGAMKKLKKDNTIPITRKEAERMRTKSPRARKNSQRNRPCVCGSEKKYKKCCWSKFSGC